MNRREFISGAVPVAALAAIPAASSLSTKDATVKTPEDFVFSHRQCPADLYSVIFDTRPNLLVAVCQKCNKRWQWKIDGLKGREKPVIEDPIAPVNWGDMVGSITISDFQQRL